MTTQVARPRTFLPASVGFAAMAAAMVAVLVAAGAPTPLLPLYEKAWHFAPSMLTLAFGVYAMALLLAILVIGSLSDHVGRRPLMIGSLALELVAMILFVNASSIGWLIVARIVQGVATGAASSSLSAAVVELAPERRKKLGALMTSMAPLAGLGIGALFSGLVAQFAPSGAAVTVWIVLVVVMAVGTVFALLTPETSSKKPGAIWSLLPRVSLPAQVRPLFVAAIPGVVGAFMIMALFLGLVPVVLGTVFAISSPVVGGLAAFATFGAGTLVVVATSSIRPHMLRVSGSSALTVASLVFIASVATHVLPLLWVAGMLGGAGLGATFAGTVRGLVPEVAPHERAGVFAAIYLVAYLALGASAIIAGIVATSIGVQSMAVDFGVVTAIISLVGLIATSGLVRRREAA